MNLQIISTLDGSTTSTTTTNLSKNLKPGIFRRVEDDGSLTHLGLITAHDLVFFARTWAGWVNPIPTQEVSLCFEMVDRWLEDEGSVTPEELEAAAEAAAEDARSAAWAARAAAQAAAWAAGAAAEAARASWASARAAARSAADAAQAAAWDSRAAAWDAMYQRQGELVLETLASR